MQTLTDIMKIISGLLLSAVAVIAFLFAWIIASPFTWIVVILLIIASRFH